MNKKNKKMPSFVEALIILKPLFYKYKDINEKIFGFEEEDTHYLKKYQYFIEFIVIILSYTLTIQTVDFILYILKIKITDIQHLITIMTLYIFIYNMAKKYIQKPYKEKIKKNINLIFPDLIDKNIYFLTNKMKEFENEDIHEITFKKKLEEWLEETKEIIKNRRTNEY